MPEGVAEAEREAQVHVALREYAKIFVNTTRAIIP
jgi:hypothetical protein